MLRSALYQTLNESSTERFRVFRIGKYPSLDNRNAGDLEGVLMFLRDNAGYVMGDTVFVHDVEAELPYREYVPYIEKTPYNDSNRNLLSHLAGHVGRRTFPSGGTVYSFPKDGKWKSTLVSQTTLKDFIAVHNKNGKIW